MSTLLIGLAILLAGILLTSFLIKDYKKQDVIIDGKKDSYDRTQMWKFATKEELKKQYHPNIKEQYEISPLLSNDRFRRRIKMLLGIDVMGYPKDGALIVQTWGSPYIINLRTQVFSIYDPNTEILVEDTLIIPANNPYQDWESEQGPDEISIYPPDSLYGILRKFALFNDLSCMDVFIDYRTQKMELLAKDPKNFDSLESFGLELEISIDFIHSLYDRALFVLDEKVLEYIATTKIEHIPYMLISDDRRTPDMRLDMVWIYASQKQTDDLSYQLYREKRILRGLINILSTPTKYEPNVWGEKYNANRSISSFLAYNLRAKDKDLNKLIIQFMSEQLDDRMAYTKINWGQVREDIRSSNYYGYTILREFCENPMREMPTLEKVGTNFEAVVKEKDVLLYLEPFADSYDIDTIQPTESFKAYEMGYDDYYFVEIEKPVESPIADANGYAKILDRTEIVHGYVLKSVVKQLNENDILGLALYTDLSKSKNGVINDPDGYTNIRSEQNTKSTLVGKIIKGEVFNYWQTPYKWYIVQTKDGLRGYVYKDRIKEKCESGGWVLD